MKKFVCLFLVLLLVPAVYASTVTRSFTPKKAMPGDTVTVTLTLDEVAQELSYIIEESIPEGWTISDNAGGEVSGSKISWLLIEGLMGSLVVEDKVFTYTILVPASAFATAVFNGTYRFESMGRSSPILGETMLNVGSAPLSVAASVSSVPAPVPYIPPTTPVPSPAAYVPTPVSPPTPSPVAQPSAYAPPAPEPTYEPEELPYIPPAETYVPPALEIPTPEAYAPPEVPEAAEVPETEAVSSFEAVPAAALPARDLKPSTTGQVPPTTYYKQPTKTWLWVIVGVVGVGGLISGGIYLKQHFKQGVPAGGQQFSTQSITYYIGEYTKLGYSKEQIISHLVKNGIPLGAVKQAFSEYEAAHQVKAG